MTELYLDIETTGLKAYDARITCIGCLHTRLGLFIFSNEDENLLLDDFFSFLSRSCSDDSSLSLVTFNGIKFDMPFIRERLEGSNFSAAIQKKWVSLLEGVESNHVDLMLIASDKYEATVGNRLSTGRISREGVLYWLNIYSPRVGGATNCILIAKTQKNWSDIWQHNAIDLFTTRKIFNRFKKLGWIK